MCVLLISPYFESPIYPLYLPSENLGLAYLASFLRIHNVAVDILDANMEWLPAEEVIDRVELTKYDVIGISLSSHQNLFEVSRIAQLLKEHEFKGHITVGGRFASIAHSKILILEQSIDSVVRGDGEETLLELFNAVRHEDSFERIKGLSFRNNTGMVVANPNRSLIANIDDLPWPARDTLAYIEKLGHPWPTQLLTSKGCNGCCTFCDVPLAYEGQWRARSANDIVDELQYLSNEYNSHLFRLTDDDFIGPKIAGKNRAREIALKVLERGLDIQLMIAAKPEAIQNNLFKLLRSAGVVDCLVGVESGVDRLLKLYKKSSTVEMNLRAIDLLRKFNIKLNLAFIMFDPRMTFCELKQNFKFLINNNIVTTDSLRSWLWPLDGTVVAKQFESGGLKSSNWFEYSNYNFLDTAVSKVFEIIKTCCHVTYHLDQTIFRARKFNWFAESDLSLILNENQKLWISIFESSLDEFPGFDFAWVEKQASCLEHKIYQFHLGYVPSLI